MTVVGLDIRALDPAFKAHAGRGTGRYVSAILSALLSEEDYLCSSSVKIRLITSADLCLSARSERFVSCLPACRQTIRNQFFMGRRLSSLQVDAVHYFFHGDVPSFGGPPSIVTVLDLIPLKFPTLYKASKTNLRYKFARFLEKLAIVNSMKLIAISEQTKRDLCELVGISPDRIFVVPLAVDDRFSPVEVGSERDSLKKAILLTFGICDTRPILLYVGGIDPRKNVNFLLRVFASVCEFYPLLHRPVLLFAGGIEKDDRYISLLEQISILRLNDDVKLLGYVSDTVLIDLYNIADALMFPSLYEGFGFPILEAMSCGCLFVAANNSSIPEVVGREIPLLADNDLEAWVTYVNNIITLKEDERNNLRTLGLERAKCFSWGSTARSTIDIYKNS